MPRALRVLVLALLAVAGADAQSRRPIRDTDLLDFVWVADPQIAPDGRAVAFVRVTVDRERDTYAASIWVVPSNAITASDPDSKDSMFDPAADKVYRHPTFYKLPADLDHM